MEAFLNPTSLSIKNTNAAVGILLRAIIVGLKTCFNFVKFPTTIPSKIPRIEAMPNPMSIRYKEPHMHLYRYGLPNNSKDLTSTLPGSGKV